MTVNKATTQGLKFQIARETALGTPGAYRDFLAGPEISLPTKATQSITPEVAGRTNPADVEPPIDIEDGSSTGTLSLYAQRGTSTNEPTLGYAFQACGMSESSADTLTTVDSATTTAITLAADNNVEIGDMLAVYNTTEARYYPVHVADWNSGTKVVTPLFATPSASTASDPVQKMWTWYPQVKPLTATQTMALTALSRVEDGSSNPQKWTYTAIGASLQQTTISANTPLKFGFDLMIGDVAGPATGSWATDTLVDRIEKAVSGNSMQCLLQAGDAASGGLTRSTVCNLQDATIDWGFGIKRIPCVGGTNVNSTGGYISDYTGDTLITITGYFDRTLFDDWRTTYTGGSGTNPDRALAFVWPGKTISHPTVMISFPRVMLADCPEANIMEKDPGVVKGTFVFKADGAGLGGEDGPTSPADQRFCIGISGELS